MTLLPEPLTLDVLRYAVQQNVSEAALTNCEISTWRDPMLNTLAVQLSRTIAAETLETVTRSRYIEVPATWWQHLKQDHAPAWFLRRRPVRWCTETLTVTVDVLAVYPDVAIPPGRESLGVSFLTTRDSCNP